MGEMAARLYQIGTERCKKKLTAAGLQEKVVLLNTISENPF